MNTTRLNLFLILLTTLPGPLWGQSYIFSGQAIGWAGMNIYEPVQFLTGIRYIPQLTFSDSVGHTYTLDAEISFHARGSATLAESQAGTTGSLKPYRAWLRFSGNRFELRAGLQKVNFGSATILRPLMWFDRMDPRDPLQLTDGVYALLGRYYFLNNANIWIWGLYGNHDTKGWEYYPTLKGTVEFGGRGQVPVPGGEMALSWHHRTADPSQILPDTLNTATRIPENRLAIDGRFDIGPGLWFEGVLIHRKPEQPIPEFRQFLNTGIDYTFTVGNGLHLSGEMLLAGEGERPFDRQQGVLFGGITASYPIGLLHQIQAMVFYDFNGKQTYRFVNWSVTTDRWTGYFMGFWNPEQYRLFNLETGENALFNGAGFQVMLVYNH
ncbi:MAG TPA: hypothetical protein ENN63_04140 [Bacteroidetes bacterium]|nr:hypothetical protein [Bacteroidota bacterium]